MGASSKLLSKGAVEQETHAALLAGLTLAVSGGSCQCSGA
jgi:hypothetical protein